MTPKQAFDATMVRVHSFLRIYEALCNTRSRRTRRDWAKRFNKFMSWPTETAIEKIDGKEAILVLKPNCPAKREDFDEASLCELLRAAHATSVAALDRYCHELILSRVIRELGRPEKKIPARLKKMSIPAHGAFKCVRHAQKNKDAHSMLQLRAVLQGVLYRDTYQFPDDIAEGFSMVGIKSLWSSVAAKIGGGAKSDDIRGRLSAIVSRRNSIVHEGDLVRHKKGGKPKLNPITLDAVRGDVEWIEKIVGAFEAVKGK